MLLPPNEPGGIHWACGRAVMVYSREEGPEFLDFEAFGPAKGKPEHCLLEFNEERGASAGASRFHEENTHWHRMAPFHGDMRLVFGSFFEKAHERGLPARRCSPVNFGAG